MAEPNQASSAMQGNPEMLGNILGDSGLAAYFASRDGSLPFLIGCLEEQEDWILDYAGSPMEGVFLRGMNERMMSAAPIDSNPAETAVVLNYLRAGRMLRILDWLDHRKENNIVNWLDDENLPASFRERVRRLLAILARGALLQKLFDMESSMELERTLLRVQKNAKEK